ncbi:dTDP-4-dehydrorhamnose reductase [Oscillibacter sp.]|uniref:dTDP-4-dehydrorhamnose reductase n=1 Tax=Oscillibacter sp. TaxID=1945593 RepID=UPI0026253D2E|nr:dTDP-4-dehydrorhamnose reductase [Oscillibacter sp.]MDD3346462.1 dTDP-4-dehydrorhamnose reductase [Oscillibacter sp.]
MKILITGATGQLGYDVCRVLSAREIEYRGIGSAQLDIVNENKVHAYLESYRPDAVIHCAAYTAVDKAEDEPERCFAVNEGGTVNLARACRDIGAKMLFLSTDYVFPGDGERFYETDDPTGPLNVYGRSKLAAEQSLREVLPEHFILRISWVFGINGGNFVKTMLRLAETHDTLTVVADQVGSPAYTADLAPLLCDMIATDKYGTYHATNEGICSWAAFAEEIFRLAGKAVTVVPTTTDAYGAKALRPKNSRLNKQSLTAAGFARLPDWQDALGRYLSELN